MAENIIKDEAEKVLLSAYRMRCVKKDIISGKIVAIISGSHKTYKYILMTGLLAKATNEKINPLALQAGAQIDGAYDARSLCHNIIVPFERDFLGSALGGSNEPFLNKPARFTHLNETNAVRKGSDKEVLNLLLEVFTSIKTAADAKAYLACALEWINYRIEELKVLQNSSIKYNPTLIEVYEFIFRFLEKSFEGETSAIIVGSLEKIYHSSFSRNFKVIAHKVNQSGASSKEVGDIDIFLDDKFHYAIEVKDKTFSKYDLEHAFKKIREAGGLKGQFIYGPNASFEQAKIDEKISEFEEDNFMILFQDIFTYSKTMVFKINLNHKQEFIDMVMHTAIEINSKDETKAWIQSLLVDFDWK